MRRWELDSDRAELNRELGVRWWHVLAGFVTVLVLVAVNW